MKGRINKSKRFLEETQLSFSFLKWRTAEFVLLAPLETSETHLLFSGARAVIPLSASITVLPDKSSPPPVSAASTLTNTVTCLTRRYVSPCLSLWIFSRGSPALSPAPSPGSAVETDSLTLIRPASVKDQIAALALLMQPRRINGI